VSWGTHRRELAIEEREGVVLALGDRDGLGTHESRAARPVAAECKGALVAAYEQAGLGADGAGQGNARGTGEHG
jgi:hypothetical protein